MTPLLWRRRIIQFLMFTRGFATEFSTREFISKNVHTTNITPRKTLFLGTNGPYMLYSANQTDVSLLDFRYGVNIEVTADGNVLSDITLPDDGTLGIGADSATVPFVFAGEELKVTVGAGWEGFGGRAYIQVCRFKYKAQS